LRVGLEAKGIKLPRGLHAKNDSHPTRGDVYATLAAQVRFDASLLKKSAAYPNARAAGKVRLFKMAIWLHLKYVIPLVSATGDRIFVIAATSRRAGTGMRFVTGSTTSVSQNAFDRTVVPCIWEAQCSLGIQAADHALWRIQGIAKGKMVPAYTDVIQGQIKSIFRPWET